MIKSNQYTYMQYKYSKFDLQIFDYTYLLALSELDAHECVHIYCIYKVACNYF